MDIPWEDIVANQILVVTSVALFLIEFKNIYRLMPQLIYSLDRPKGGLSFEYNVSTSRSRNQLALCCIIPIGLIIDKFQLYTPSFWSNIDRSWSALACISLVCAFGIVRMILHGLIMTKHPDLLKRSALRRGPYSFLIVLTILMVFTSFLFSFIDISASAARLVFWIEIGLAFLMFMIRNMQILSSFCSFLRAFLYLCALEIAPLAILVASAIYL